MQGQLKTKAKEAVILRSAADAIEELNTDPLMVSSLREWADEADEQVEQLEHNVAEATARLAIMSRGLPDPGMGPASF